MGPRGEAQSRGCSSERCRHPLATTDNRRRMPGDGAGSIGTITANHAPTGPPLGGMLQIHKPEGSHRSLGKFPGGQGRRPVGSGKRRSTLGHPDGTLGIWTMPWQGRQTGKGLNPSSPRRLHAPGPEMAQPRGTWPGPRSSKGTGAPVNLQRPPRDGTVFQMWPMGPLQKGVPPDGV